MLDASYLRDRIAAADPDFTRLRMAARATLTAMTATSVLEIGARLLHRSASTGLLGVMIATTGVVFVNDATPRGQRVTTMLLPLVASAAIVAGTLASLHAWTSLALLPVAVFAAVFARVFHATSSVVFFARPLVAAEGLAALGAEAAASVREVGRMLADGAHALADAVEQGSPAELASAAPRIEVARGALTEAEAKLRGSGSPSAILCWLESVDEALAALAQAIDEVGPGRLAPHR